MTENNESSKITNSNDSPNFSSNNMPQLNYPELSYKKTKKKIILIIIIATVTVLAVGLGCFVVEVGDNEDGQCNAEDWQLIVDED